MVHIALLLKKVKIKIIETHRGGNTKHPLITNGRIIVPTLIYK